MNTTMHNFESLGGHVGKLIIWREDGTDRKAVLLEVNKSGVNSGADTAVVWTKRLRMVILARQVIQVYERHIDQPAGVDIVPRVGKVIDFKKRRAEVINSLYDSIQYPSVFIGMSVVLDEVLAAFRKNGDMIKIIRNLMGNDPEYKQKSETINSIMGAWLGVMNWIGGSRDWDNCRGSNNPFLMGQARIIDIGIEESKNAEA